MPVLKKEVEKITLKESGAKVTISKRMTAGVAIPATQAGDDYKGTLQMLEAMIIDWDFTDEKMVKLPIEAGVINDLSLDDFTQLAVYVRELAEKGQSKQLTTTEVKS